MILTPDIYVQVLLITPTTIYNNVRINFNKYTLHIVTSKLNYGIIPRALATFS